MADGATQLLSADSIPNSTAQTATFMNFDLIHIIAS